MKLKVFNFNALYSNGKTVYFEKKGKVYCSDNYGETTKYLASYPRSYLEKMGGIFKRIFRGGLHSFLILPNDTIISIKRKAILFKSKNSEVFQTVFKIKRGSRPLNICYNPIHDKLYFGEYFSNKERTEVYVYGSKNGKEWEKIYTFSKGIIRHIHGIYYDQFRKGIWILSGDTNKESHLWFTSDDFKTVKSIIGGTQKARAVSIIPIKEGLIVPTDTPYEQNFIQFFDITNKEFKVVSELPGSAFYAESLGSVNLVSTIVEKSEVNNINFTSVYGSNKIDKWVNLINLKQDLFSKISLKLFSYPEIKFAKLSTDSPYFFLNCKGVEKYSGKCLRISKSELLKYLN